MLTVASPPLKGAGGDVNNQRVIKEFINTDKLFDR